MEKVSETHSSVMVSSPREEYGKIVLKLNYKSIFEMIFCFLFTQTAVFSQMLPLGVAFYGSVFSKKNWVLNYLACVLSVLFFVKDSPGIYIAVFTLVSLVMALFDYELWGYRVNILLAVPFFVLKLFSLIGKGFIAYDIFALVLETAIVFAAAYVFQKGFPLIASISKRSFISTSEMLCSFVFMSLSAMAVSEFEPIYGVTVSGVVSILMIYIFSLGGINGGAVILGVLLGTIGSLKLESFGLTTATYAFGALLASSFCSYGKIGVVLGFVISNTAASIILSDASRIAVSIYDSLAAAVMFAFIPQKFCTHISGFFSKGNSGYKNNSIFLNRSRERITSRLDEMSQSFCDLAKCYNSSLAPRELGRDYIMSKFREVTKISCMGCPSKQSCFDTASSKGYHHMAKMLETAFKCGKITPHTMPAGFKSNCRRCDSFAEKFNSVFDIIKTERMWLSKLNDTRQLISRQLLAISDALITEKEKCSLSIDQRCEELLWAELDKEMLFPKSLTAEFSDGARFIITVVYPQKNVKSNTSTQTMEVLSRVLSKKLSASEPKVMGEDVVYSFYPAHKYEVSVGFASKAKDGEKKCGDSIGFINTDSKIFYAVLSDGMGSGEAAQKESQDAINLMEKFIRAGFDSDTAVRLINSSLLLKSSRDSFSTVDLCKCDLSDALITFTKLGSACSYIKSDGKISNISGYSLPAGILKDIEIENHYLSVNTDTLIVMLSDGIGDIAIKNKDMDGWIEKELSNITTDNPQIIASQLMKKAVKLQNGRVHDDMTVIVIGVNRNDV